MDKLITPILVGIVAPIVLISAAVARRNESSDGERRALISGALLLSLVWTLRDKKSRDSGFNQTLAALSVVGAGGIWAARLISPPIELAPATQEQKDLLTQQQQIQQQLSQNPFAQPIATQQGMPVMLTQDMLPPGYMLAPIDQQQQFVDQAMPEAPPEPQPRAQSNLKPVSGANLGQERKAQAQIDLRRVLPGLEKALTLGRGADPKFWASNEAAELEWVTPVLMDFAKSSEQALSFVAGLGAGQLEGGKWGLAIPLDDDPATNNHTIADVTALVEYIGKTKSAQQPAQDKG